MSMDSLDDSPSMVSPHSYLTDDDSPLGHDSSQDSLAAHLAELDLGPNPHMTAWFLKEAHLDPTDAFRYSAVLADHDIGTVDALKAGLMGKPWMVHDPAGCVVDECRLIQR